MADSSRDIELRIRLNNLTSAGLKEAIAGLNQLTSSLESQAKSARDALAAHRAAMEAGTASGKAATDGLKAYERTLDGLEKRLQSSKNQLQNFNAELNRQNTEAVRNQALEALKAFDARLELNRREVEARRKAAQDRINSENSIAIAAAKRAASEKALFDESLARTRAATIAQIEAQKAATAAQREASEKRLADTRNFYEDARKLRQRQDDAAIAAAVKVARSAGVSGSPSAVAANYSVELNRSRRGRELLEEAADKGFIDRWLERRRVARALDESRQVASENRTNSRQEATQARFLREQPFVPGQPRTDAMGRPGRGASGQIGFLGLRPYELTNLGYQVNDVISGFASGQNATQILAQQGGQFIQIFGTAALKWFPLVAVAAGAAAVAIGSVTRSLQEAASRREFTAFLTVTPGTGFTPGYLASLRKELRDLGVSFEDAGKIIKEGVLANIRPERLSEFTLAARNMARVTGKDVTEAMKDLTEGLHGGEAAIRRLLVQYPLLNDKEKQHVDSLLAEHKGVESQNYILGLLNTKYKEARDQAVGPLEEASRKLAKAWDDLLITFGNSKTLGDLVTNFAALVGNIQSAVEWLDKIADRLDDPKLQQAFSRLGIILNPAGAAADALAGATVGAGGFWSRVGAVLGIGSGPGPATTGVPGAPLLTTRSATAADEGAGASGRAGLAAEALSQLGLNENRDRDKIRSYLASGGANLDPATVAWCAAFANAVLARKGLAGTGTNIATDFLKFGSPVSGLPQAGDILVQPRGRGAGQIGGHVGFASGEIRGEGANQQFEMISGNSGRGLNEVTRAWVNAADVVVRRATQAGTGPFAGQTPGQSDASAVALRDAKEALTIVQARRKEEELATKEIQIRRDVEKESGITEAGTAARAQQDEIVRLRLKKESEAIDARQFQQRQTEAKQLEEDRRNSLDTNRIIAGGQAAVNKAVAEGRSNYEELYQIRKTGEADVRNLLQRQKSDQDALENAEKRIADLRRAHLNEHKSALDQINEATNLHYDNEIKQLEKLRERSNLVDKERYDRAIKAAEAERQVELGRNPLKAAEQQANESLKTRNDLIQTYTKLEAAGEITITEKEKGIKEAFDLTRQSTLGAINIMEAYLKSTEGLKETPERIALITARIKELKAETKYVDPFWKGLKDTFTQSFSSGLDTAFNTVAEAIGGAIAKTKEWKDVWVSVKNAALNFFAQLLKDIASYILKAQALKLISGLFPGLGLGGSDSGGGFLGGLFGNGNSATGVGIGADYGGGGELGVAASSGFLRSGGVIGRTPQTQLTDPSWWANAPRYRTGTIVGLAPDEQRAILHRGEEVLSADNPRNILNGGGRTGPISIRNVLVDDKRRIAEAMQGAHGERVIVQAVIRNGATIRELARG